MEQQRAEYLSRAFLAKFHTITHIRVHQKPFTLELQYKQINMSWKYTVAYFDQNSKQNEQDSVLSKLYYSFKDDEIYFKNNCTFNQKFCMTKLNRDQST